jgi:hypothetical protein
MDRAYVDFERLFLFTLCSAFFVFRTKTNVQLQRRYSRPVDKTTGLRSDQTVILTTIESAKVYPDPVRRSSRAACPDASPLLAFGAVETSLPKILLRKPMHVSPYVVDPANGSTFSREPRERTVAISSHRRALLGGCNVLLAS